MDRFIALNVDKNSREYDFLKSSMDRFIVSPNDYVPNALQILKSSMDRFIAQTARLWKLYSSF